MHDQELDEKLKRKITTAIIQSYPAGFWRELYDRIAGMYADMYEQIKHDGTVLDSQKICKLQQDRPFKIDWVMAEVAKRHGISCSTEAVPNNGWNHAYAVSGNLGITQSYVPTFNDFPQHAKFREALSKASKFPQLEFEDQEAFNKEYEFYGLIAHTPIARRFDEQSCKLGSAQLCIPHPGMNEWALTVGLLELESLYTGRNVATEIVARKTPSLKKRSKKDENDH